MNESILSHVSLGTDDLAMAEAFYTPVLSTLGIRLVERVDAFAIAYGRKFPEFWLNLPLDDAGATTGNGTHVAFLARSPSEVDAFHAAALAAGATDAGAPGARAHYGAPYYGCFVHDPDGHKLEAMTWRDL